LPHKYKPENDYISVLQKSYGLTGTQPQIIREVKTPQPGVIQGNKKPLRGLAETGNNLKKPIEHWRPAPAS